MRCRRWGDFRYGLGGARWALGCRCNCGEYRRQKKPENRLVGRGERPGLIYRRDLSHEGSIFGLHRQMFIYRFSHLRLENHPRSTRSCQSVKGFFRDVTVLRILYLYEIYRISLSSISVKRLFSSEAVIPRCLSFCMPMLQRRSLGSRRPTRRVCETDERATGYYVYVSIQQDLDVNSSSYHTKIPSITVDTFLQCVAIGRPFSFPASIFPEPSQILAFLSCRRVYLSF